MADPMKAALDAAHGFDVDGMYDGFHRTCALSNSVRTAIDAYVFARHEGDPRSMASHMSSDIAGGIDG